MPAIVWSAQDLFGIGSVGQSRKGRRQHARVDAMPHARLNIQRDLGSQRLELPCCAAAAFNRHDLVRIAMNKVYRDAIHGLRRSRRKSTGKRNDVRRQCRLGLGRFQRHDGALRKADERGVCRSDARFLLQLLDQGSKRWHCSCNAPGAVVFRDPRHRKPLTTLPEIAGLQPSQTDDPCAWKFGGKLLTNGHQVLRVGAYTVEQQDQLLGGAFGSLNNDRCGHIFSDRFL